MGDIVKVTPSSKAVGDLALFMVQNDLDEETLLERADELDLPRLGRRLLPGDDGPAHGRLSRGAAAQGAQRAGADHVPSRRAVGARRLRRGPDGAGRGVRPRDFAIGTCSAPSFTRRCFKSFMEHRAAYSDTSVIDTPTFFYGLALGEETRIEMEPGKTLVVKLTAVGELLEDGTRIVYFELNGQPREGARRRRERQGEAGRAAQGRPAQPQPHRRLDARATSSRCWSRGEPVAKGQALVVTEAMKVEQTIQAPRAGTVTEVLVKAGDTIQAGDLLLRRRAVADE